MCDTKYLKLFWEQNTKYLKMNKSDLNKRETPGSLSSSASFAVGQRPW